jgi:hypothetical protein
MVFENNPTTEQLHSNWRNEIHDSFPNISFGNAKDYLSIVQYIHTAPQKFYNKEAFEKYFSFLNNFMLTNPVLLSELLSECEHGINIGNKSLTEVNTKPIHDVFFPDEDNALLNFIDKEIHYNYLKILEGLFYQFIFVIAKHSRINRGVSPANLDLYNSYNEINTGDFQFIQPLYNNVIRNGIGHGKIVFKDYETEYIDKKGNKETIATKEIIRKFDALIDVTNGFALAFKLFCFTNLDFFEKNKINIPQSVLIEELQAQSNSPAWKVINCLDSIATFQNKKQLIIYAENSFWDYNKVLYNTFRTAILAEKFAVGYERFFFKLNSKHSPNGWAAFDGTALKDLRESGTESVLDYNAVLEGNLLFFIPKIKFPKIVYKLGTLYSIISATLPLGWRNYKDKFFPNPFVIRETKAHTKKYFTVVQNPSVIIKKEFQNDVQSLIRKNYKRIVRSVIKYSRKQESIFSGVRYKPVKYIRVYIYDTDFRVRNLRSSGLIPELVCTIQVDTTRLEKLPDIFGGIPEQIGKYRVVWNKRWSEAQP